MGDRPVTPSLMDEPFVLAGRRLRNRVVHTSMSTFMAKDAQITDRLIRYYANRAKGGAAMVVTEPLGTAPHQSGWTRPKLWGGTQLDGFKRWADAVESQGCRLLGQIQDSGRGRHETGRTFNAIGASRLPDDLSWSMPRELTTGEVIRLVE